jgi:hypothetical protein
VSLVSHIRSQGYEGMFYQKTMTYCEENGMVYWTMDAPLEKPSSLIAAERKIRTRVVFRATRFRNNVFVSRGQLKDISVNPLSKFSLRLKSQRLQICSVSHFLF